MTTAPAHLVAAPPLARDHRVAAWRALLEVHGRVMADLETELRAHHNLSITDFDVLINLAPHEACRHTDLANRVILTRTGLTRLLDRLCGRGLLVRTPDPTDGRGVLLRLTDEGRTRRRAASRAHNRIIRAHFAAVPDDESAHLLATLTLLLTTGKDH